MRAETAIAIIGGGVSGLAHARALADLGFTRVVVFERAAEVGGKACTIELDGRAHDLGATMGVPIDYRRVLGFSREAGIATERFPPEQHYCLERGRAVELGRWRDAPRLLAEAASYLHVAATRWRVADELHRAPPELFAPWAEVAARRGLGAVSRRMLCYRTGYGYGFDDEVPAVLYTNLLRPQTVLGLAVAPAFVWRGGTQPIWTALASRLERRVEIRRATAVTRIDRSAGGVTVHSAGRSERFDLLVIACNPRDLAGVLDARGAEREWFAQIRTYPYATVACEVEGLAAGRTSVGYLDANMRRERVGHPMAWVKRYADRDLYVFHLFAPPDLSDAAVAARIAGDVARLGGRLARVRAARRWQFFPHFSSELMRAGGLAAIDRWQGRARTYLVGEVLSFASMARCTEHATAMAYRLAAARAPGDDVAERLAS